MNTNKVDPIFEIFGDMKRPPRQQSEKEKASGEFKKIFESCKKALGKKEGGDGY